MEVQWVRNYPRGGGIELDVELLRRMAADSPRAGEILVTAAPLVFRAQWSLLLQASVPRVTFSTPGAPYVSPETVGRFRPFDTVHRVMLEPGWLPGWDAHHAVVAPMGEEQVVVVGRRGEPPFFRSELARLAHVVGGASHTDVSDEPVFTADATHRHPIAAPLYTRGFPDNHEESPAEE